jgi:putative transcriptional regulator
LPSPQASANAARKGLNVLAIVVGDMSKAFTRELESEKIKYNIIDGAL